MEHWERDKKNWRFLRWLLGGWVRRIFNYTPEPIEAEGPFLLLANHVTDWDPILIGLSFREQMYFVASEHIFHWGLVWKIINWFSHPIARLKGTTASDTVMTVMRRIKKGASVAIFAEGDRSWDGKTGDILPSTGKLAKNCGGTLITYRFEGGYFTSPRWAGRRVHRGRMRGYAAGIYTHEQLRTMSAEQINEIIKRDLWEDAYDRQRRECVAYRGKKLAEGLETMLCICPNCGKIDSFSVSGDRLSCGCGFKMRYTEYGYFEGEEVPFNNIQDWDRWQTAALYDYTDSADNGKAIFTDTRIALYKLLENHGQQPLGRGELKLHRDRLVCAGHEFLLSGISGMGLQGHNCLIFTSDGEHYELIAKDLRCLRKYLTIYNYLRRNAQPAVKAAR